MCALTGAAACAVAPVALAQHRHGTEQAMTGPMVAIGFDSFAPPGIEALTGDTITWPNDSARPHTVTADDGSFDSGRIVVGGSFEQRVGVAGVVAYHCSMHPSMIGEVDVYDLLLDHPTAPAGPRRPYPLRGRSALPSGTPVTIEADTGSGFAPAANTTVADDGTFAATVVPSTTAAFRAVAGAAASPRAQLIVLDHTIKASVRRLKGHRVQLEATVTPAAPGSKVVLQLHLRERFGWWPAQTLHLDAQSHARFLIHQRARVPARVALTLPDGTTVLATSRTHRRY